MSQIYVTLPQGWTVASNVTFGGEPVTGLQVETALTFSGSFNLPIGYTNLVFEVEPAEDMGSFEIQAYAVLANLDLRIDSTPGFMYRIVC